MAKQNVTLSIESSTWEAYQNIESAPSHEVEKFMEEKISVFKTADKVDKKEE